MAKPKLNVTQVWVLQRVVDYEGSEILNVYLDDEEVRKEKTDLGNWKYDEHNDYWVSDGGQWGQYYLLTRHPILVTRKSKPQSDGPTSFGQEGRRRYVPVVPGHAPDGTWRCATCGQPGDEDCIEGPHISFNKDDWYQPDLVQKFLDQRNIN